ncbi:AMP-binding protein [Streptomyces sp. NPDC085932]|uniref:AMP-binding protein n=1 Tax=Streptomyces sp. NPDC085932 TaxID=3365741 RepID=UPI0037D7EF4C
MLEILARHALTQPLAPALRSAAVDGPKYSYGQFALAVDRVAGWLRDHQLRTDEPVLFVAESSCHWPIIDFAVMLAGGLPMAVPPGTPDETVAPLIRSSRVRQGVVVDTSQIPRMQRLGCIDIFDLSPHVLNDLLATPSLNRSSRKVFEGLLAKGESSSNDDTAYLAPSSGSTGAPKACQMTYGNMRFFGSTLQTCLALTTEDRIYSFLPLSQARLTDVVLPLHCGFETVMGTGKLWEELAAARPTMMVAPPFFYRRLQEHAMSSPAGTEAAMRELLGQARYVFTGAAPAPTGLLDFYQEHGIQVLEGYGMTESSSLASLNLPGRHRPGTQGQSVPGVSVRLSPQGEIEVSGPNVCAGYWRDPDGTQRTLREGWLRTGDFGVLDADGYLQLLGRAQERMELADGSQFWPGPVEADFGSVPGVERAVLVGNGHRRLAVLLALDTDADFHPEKIRATFDHLLAAHQERMGSEVLASWHVVAFPFTVESGELTALLKPRRAVIHERRRELIQLLCD